MKKSTTVTTLILTLLLTALSAGAKTKTRLPASGDLSLEIATVLGDRETKTVVRREAGKESISFTSNDGIKIEHALTARDFDYVLREYQALAPSPVLSANCYRSRITIAAMIAKKTVENKASCYGISSTAAKSYERFSQILVNAL